MNLAVGAILLFTIFIVPPLIFRRFYYTGEFSKEYFKSTPFQVFLAAIPLGVVFQTIHYLISIKVFDYEPDLNILATLTLGGSKEDLKNAVVSFKDNVYDILVYNFTLWAWVGVSGMTLRFVVRKFKLDRKVRLFRFQNTWYYLLRGEIFDFPNIKGNIEKVDFAYIDATVNMGSKTVLYSGILKDYRLSKEGSGLEYLYLSEVKRRDFDDDSQQDKKYYHIPGDFFVIPFEKIINFNISYYTLEPVPASEVARRDTLP